MAMTLDRAASDLLLEPRVSGRPGFSRPECREGTRVAVGVEGEPAIVTWSRAEVDTAIARSENSKTFLSKNGCCAGEQSPLLSLL